MKQLFVAALAGLLLSACGSDSAESDADAVAMVEEDGVRFEKAILRPPFGGRDVAAGYVTITASGDGAVSITSIETPIATTSELHTHMMVDGKMAMRRVERYDIPAGDSLELRTGAEHMMFFGVEQELSSGQQVPVTLTYTVGNSAPREVEIDFTVTPLD